MATIFPPANGVSFNREEAAANTEFPKRKLPAALTPAQLDELRAKSATNNPNSHSARNAKAAAERAVRQAAAKQ